MPTDIIYSDDGADHLTYFSKAHPEINRRVSRCDLVGAAFIAREWHGGQWTGLYALSCGSFDYETVERAHREACSAAARFRGDFSDPTVNDAYYGLLSMIEDLSRCLDPRFGEGALCAECGKVDAADMSKYCAACEVRS